MSFEIDQTGKLALVVCGGMVFWGVLALVAIPSMTESHERQQRKTLCEPWRRAQAQCVEPAKPSTPMTLKEWEAWDSFARCSALAGNLHRYGCTEGAVLP
jgi:hypothetical protein